MLHATVVDNTNSGTVPTGSLSFTDTVGSTITSIGTASLASGAAVLSYSPATAGSHTIAASYTPSNTTSFRGSNSSVSMIVNQQTTTAVLTPSATSIVPGQSLTLTAKVTAASSGVPTGTVTFLDGSATLATVALTNGSATYSTAALLSGSHTLGVTYSGDANYATSAAVTNSTVITVASLDFSLTPTGTTSQAVSRGGQANFSLALAPTYGAYPGVITFTASGLPPGATATFSPSSIAVAAGPQTLTLTIQTSAVSAKTSVPLHRGTIPLTLALFLLPIAGARSWRTRHITLVLLLGLSVVGSAGLSGCSSGGSSQPASQNYTIAVTANSGGTSQHVANLTLTVQ